jgi:hypothetical protein
MMQRYEITVELPNGNWVWTIGTFDDYHQMIICALDYAASKGARVHHVELIQE